MMLRSKRNNKLPAALFFLFAGGLIFQINTASAQDTLKQQTIDIYNVYQPKLRNAARLNLTASLPGIDTSRPRLVYNIPAQNLYFSYQPVPLRPLSMGKDSLATLQNNFIKIGLGNYGTPLIQAGLGSGRNDLYNYSAFFNHLSSQGTLEHQNFSNDNVGLRGQYYSSGHEFHAGFNYDRDAINYYGYDHDTVKLSKNDVHQTYNTVSVNAGLSNITENKAGFNYQPGVKMTGFFDAFGRRESSLYVELPVQKKILNGISIVASFIGDFSHYNAGSDSSFSNNVSTIHPAVNIDKPGFLLHAGVNPTWTNGKFYLLPDIVNETNLVKDRLILSSGWISYVIKNSYQHLVNTNPFIGDYISPLNTRVEEKYTGIKGTIGHIVYNTKFSFLTYTDMPLFVNNTPYGNKFNIRYEDQLNAYQLHGEIGYIEEEKFQVKLSGDWFNYFKEKTERKPYGLVPFQLNLYLQYTLLQHLHITADASALSGSYFLNRDGSYGKTKGALDINAGGAYDISKNFSIWANFNNILDVKYQRWHNFPSYGLNFLGGIMYKF